MLTRQLIKEAVSILIRSPFYFKFPLRDRKKLVMEFCTLHFNGAGC